MLEISETAVGFLAARDDVDPARLAHHAEAAGDAAATLRYATVAAERAALVGAHAQAAAQYGRALGSGGGLNQRRRAELLTADRQRRRALFAEKRAAMMARRAARAEKKLADFAARAADRPPSTEPS